MNAVPHKCPTCCSEMVDVEDGRVQNWYGRLVFPKDAPPHLCPNCATPLVPSALYDGNNRLTALPIAVDNARERYTRRPVAEQAARMQGRRVDLKRPVGTR